MSDATRTEDRSNAELVADRVVGITNPATVLDVGCGTGALVRALRDRGVDASGLDLSEGAGAADDDVREHVRPWSVAEPVVGRYSLVTCIGLLQQLAPEQAQQAIDRITEATDRVLLSDDPDDAERSPVGTPPTRPWAATFAERGFFRRTDVDLSFLSPWAVLLERADLTVHELAARYESHHAQVNTELVTKRAALLDAHRRLSQAQQGQPSTAEVEEQAALVEQWQAEVLEARHHVLTVRDHIIGTEAEVTRLRRDEQRLRRELARSRKQVQNVRGRLDELRTRVQRLTRKNEQLTEQLAAAQSRPSVARRAARRILGGRR